MCTWLHDRLFSNQLLLVELNEGGLKVPILAVIRVGLEDVLLYVFVFAAT
jgi:hypothetical protein